MMHTYCILPYGLGYWIEAQSPDGARQLAGVRETKEQALAIVTALEYLAASASVANDLQKQLADGPKTSQGLCCQISSAHRMLGLYHAN